MKHEIELRSWKQSNPENLKAFQEVLEAAPTYSKNVSGELAAPKAAQESFLALPEGLDPSKKFVFGIYKNNHPIGCIDLLRGYPETNTAMLGLLLLRESHQGQGLGRSAYVCLEKFILGWTEIEQIRIGVVKSNDKVLGFWKSLGFVDTGLRRPYENGKIRSESIVLVKALKPS